jgi:hypothetical protein
MNSKQLANVLLKILGLSVCIHSVPSLVSGLFFLVMAQGPGSHGVTWAYPGSTVLLVVIGVYLVVKSRTVTEMLFEGDDESLKDA